MERLMLFGRRPIAGRVKTRLVPHLGIDDSLELYRAFLSDQLRFLGALRTRYDVELWTDGPFDSPLLQGIRLRDQGTGDLGDRLLRAFASAEHDGASAAVVIGSDSPTLPARFVDDAFAALASGSPAVIAPAEDGGFVLLGMRRTESELFRDVPWGSSEVLGVTAARADAGGIGLARLPPWYDVDDASGLERLRESFRRGELEERAPDTASCLRQLDATDPPMV